MLLENSAKDARAHRQSGIWHSVALLPIAAFLLSGCTPEATSGPEATEEARGGASESPSVESQKPRETPTAPTAEPESGRDGLTAATRTAEHFLDLYGYTVQSGDTEQLEELSLEGCEFCQSAIRWTEKTYSSGKHQIGGDIRYKEGRVSTDADLSPGQVQVVFEADQMKADVYSSSGSIVESSPRASYWMGVNLESIDGQWRIVSVSGVSK